MAGQDDKENGNRTPEENMRKYNSGHSKRQNVTWNEINKKVRNKKDRSKFIHE